MTSVLAFENPYNINMSIVYHIFMNFLYSNIVNRSTYSRYFDLEKTFDNLYCYTIIKYIYKAYRVHKIRHKDQKMIKDIFLAWKYDDLLNISDSYTIIHWDMNVLHSWLYIKSNHKKFTNTISLKKSTQSELE